MFSEKLKELRQAKGVTQAELADKIYVSRSAICKWEMGRGIPSDINLSALCEFFSVTEEELLSREDLKGHIKLLKRLELKSRAASLIGILFSLFGAIFSFVGIFSIKKQPDIAYPPVMRASRSMFDVLGYRAMSIPIIIYVMAICISVISLLGVVKEKYKTRYFYLNLAVSLLAVVIFAVSFICSVSYADTLGMYLSFSKSYY